MRFDTHFHKSLSTVISLKLFGCNSPAAGTGGPAVHRRTNGPGSCVRRKSCDSKSLSSWFSEYDMSNLKQVNSDLLYAVPSGLIHGSEYALQFSKIQRNLCACNCTTSLQMRAASPPALPVLRELSPHSKPLLCSVIHAHVWYGRPPPSSLEAAGSVARPVPQLAEPARKFLPSTAQRTDCCASRKLASRPVWPNSSEETACNL